ncbi:MAG: hypothetical protein RLZZ546_1463 [Bacteroidota bacterium]|jgi:hypothetical protein
MEVHHHSHHPKKWKEYITEFLMLFLAVSLGFMAENIREEQIIAHQTESVIAQLRLELIQDTVQLSNIKRVRAKLDTAVGFIAYYIKKDEVEKNLESFYLLHTYVLYRTGIFESGCIALDQLKFTGLLKNIKDERLRSAIELYNLSIKLLEGRGARENNFMDKYTDDLRTVPFDIYKAYGPELEYLNTEKGKTVTEANVICNNSTLHLNILQTFVPDQLKLKQFDKKAYLNTLFKLNGIRNSTQDRQADIAYTRAIDLIQSIEASYPDIKNNTH